MQHNTYKSFLKKTKENFYNLFFVNILLKMDRFFFVHDILFDKLSKRK